MLDHDIVRLFRVVEVAKHVGGTGHADLAFHVVADFFGGLRLEDGDGVHEQGIADAEGTEVAVAVAGAGGADFTHAVALGQREAAAVVLQEAVELGFGTGIHGVAAGTGRLEEAEVEAVRHLLAVHELFVMGRDHQSMGRTVFLDIVANFLLVELRDDDILEAEAEGHMEAGDDAVGGEHRDDVQEALVSRVGDAAVLKGSGDGIEAVMAQHNALRHTGRAAGQGDGCTVVLTVGRGVGSFRIGGAVLREGVPGDDVAFFFDLRCRHLELLDEFDGFWKRGVRGDDDDLLESHLLKIVFQFIIEEVDQKEDLRAGAVDELLHLFCGQTRIERYDRSAELVEAIQGINGLRERDGRACDDVALLDTEGFERCRGIVGLVDQLTISDLPIEVIHRDVVLKAFIAANDRFIDRFFRNFSFLCFFAEELHPGFFHGGKTFYIFHSVPFRSCFL